MENVRDGVKKVLESRSFNPFLDVKLGHLEFASPRIADVCDEFEKLGCSRIIAYPLFISVSSHSERDIPNALNIRFHDHSDEDIRRYTGSLPVTMTTPMDHGPLLPQMVSQCASEISTTPESESVIILSHGGGCEHFWEHMHRRVAHAVRDATGIAQVSWLPVQTGRSPESQDRLAESVRLAQSNGATNVLLLSCFGGLSGKEFIARVNDGLTKRGKSPLSGVTGCNGWTSRQPVLEEIADVAQRSAAAACGLGPIPSSTAPVGEFPPYDPPFWLTRDRPGKEKKVMGSIQE